MLIRILKSFIIYYINSSVNSKAIISFIIKIYYIIFIYRFIIIRIKLYTLSLNLNKGNLIIKSNIISYYNLKGIRNKLSVLYNKYLFTFIL
jgi:hypothetical protein